MQIATTMTGGRRRRARWLAIAAAAATAIAGAAGCDDPREDESEESPTTGQGQAAIGIRGPGGWLKGTARAFYPGLGNTIVELAGASLHALDIVNNVTTPAVPSDVFGSFRIPVANGSYRVCWSKPGFTTGCTPNIYTINDASISLGLVNLAPASRRVRGAARLADENPCGAVEPFFGTNVGPRADMLNQASVVQVSTPLNHRGEFVLPILDASFKVRVTCGGATVEAPVGNMDSTGVVRHAFVIPNRRPTIRPILATIAGQDVQGVLPGTTVQLATQATDPDGNPLTFTWKTSSGTISGAAGTKASWTLPSTQGVFQAHLAAYDGRGGFASRSVSLRVRTSPTVLFSGNVRDDSGLVVAGASVSIGPSSTATDAKGHFAMTVAEGSSYLLNISKAGYVEYSRRMRAPGRGEKHVLVRADAHPIPDPTVDVVIEDTRRTWLEHCVGDPCRRRIGGRVRIPGNSIDLTVAPHGGLIAYIATIDPSSEVMPGDQTAVNSNQVPTALLSYGALFIEIRDADGHKYNLAPGKLAEVEIPIQPNIMAAEQPPVSIDTWKYHPESGLWEERPAASPRTEDPPNSGNHYYKFLVPNFSTQNADIEKVNPACLYIEGEKPIGATLYARLQIDVTPNGVTRAYEVPLDEDTTTFYNLPTDTGYTVDLFADLSGKKVLKNSLGGTTGGPWGGVGDPGKSEPDCTVLTIKEADFNADLNAVDRFLSEPGKGSEADADKYYKTIDLNGERATLGGFWKKNGFDEDNGSAPDEVKAAFINFNDLGFGRDMHCRKNAVGDVACYVTNYGGPTQAPGNFDLAKEAHDDVTGANGAKANALKTVAMEYSPGPGGPSKVVKFYVYAGGLKDSILEPSADLDGSGEKYVPHLCLNCHGGEYQPDQADLGASFREFDIYSYRDGTIVGPPGSLAAGNDAIVHPTLGQEEKFLALNKMVRDTAPASAITELIDKWYHDNDTLPFAPDAVPGGWADSTDTKDLYRKVVARSCRTCHVAQATSSWGSYAQFAGKKGLVGIYVCLGDPGQSPMTFEDDKRFRRMPHASITFKNFWLDPEAYKELGKFTDPTWGPSINSGPATECVP